jgi:hypothetical protein
VAGIDLLSNKVVWKHKNGTSRDSSPIPIGLPIGVPSMGGSIVTASGLGFLSGTLDQYLRAYDVNTGKELWKSRLPAGGQATPMTYTGKDGKQYVLVTAGGHGSALKTTANLHGKLPRPLPRLPVELHPHPLILKRRFQLQRPPRIRIDQQRTDAQHHLRQGQRRGPVFVQDIQPDLAVLPDIGMPHGRLEAQLRRMIGVIRRKLHIEKKHPAFIRAARRPHQRRLPMKRVVPNRPRAAIGRWILAEIM